MSLFNFHESHLTKLKTAAQYRILSFNTGRIFSSNDYLALANSTILKSAAINAIENDIPIGSGGSRLLSGNHQQHIQLEEQAANFFKSQACLFFANGYAANIAVISTLPQANDIILYDALIHASSHDGMRLARCDAQPFRHNDIHHLEEIIKISRAKNNDGQIWILFETLYSMDGDIAPIDELQVIAKRYNAIMVIDEAHATGIFGQEGRGLAAHLDGQDNIIILRTCGKALGCEGALLCLPTIAKDFVINRARHFIFSTAPSPFMASLVSASLRTIQNQPERREKLLNLCQYAAEKLAPYGERPYITPIIPIIIGDSKRTMEIAAALQSQGFDVRGVRPPTVPEGTSRLRICISLNIDENDIDNLTKALERLL